MQICGDITDEDIVKSNAELEEVLQLAAGRSIDETKKGVRAAIRETKKKKDEIGPRIDECRKGLADINLAAVDDARIDVKMVPGQIEALRKKKLEESSMDQSVKDRERLAEVNAKILELKAARQTFIRRQSTTLWKRKSRLAVSSLKNRMPWMLSRQNELQCAQMLNGLLSPSTI